MNWILRYAASCFVVLVLFSFLGCAKSSLMSMIRPEATENAESNPDIDTSAVTIWHDSYASAMQESANTGKPILADFTGSDWCHWCVKLKQDVFETATFKSWANDNVILLELDYPRRSQQNPEIKKQNADLAKRYNIDSYPTVLLLDSNGEVLGKMGYLKDPSAWIKLADTQLFDR